MFAYLQLAYTLKELRILAPHSQSVGIEVDVRSQSIQGAVGVEWLVGVFLLEDIIGGYSAAGFLRISFAYSSFKVGEIIAEMVFGVLLYPQRNMHMVRHYAICIHGDHREIHGELMDSIGNRSSERTPFHVCTSRKAGGDHGIADYLTECFGARGFLENDMIIGGGVIIMITLAAGIGTGEIGIVGLHNFYSFVLKHSHNFKSFC